MIKNILSIDIDFFMKDLIEYQKFVDDEVEDPNLAWDIAKMKYQKDFIIDEEAKLWVKDLIQKKCSNVKKFCIIQEHDEIYNLMKSWGCNNASCTNIDYHHDITYQQDDSKLNIENWVKYARKDNLIYSYLWIHQDGSEMCVESPIQYMHGSWKDFTYKEMDLIPEYDAVVFCVSKYFTYYKYWNIAEELQSYLIKVLNINKVLDNVKN